MIKPIGGVVVVLKDINTAAKPLVVGQKYTLLTRIAVLPEASEFKPDDFEVTVFMARADIEPYWTQTPSETTVEEFTRFWNDVPGFEELVQIERVIAADFQLRPTVVQKRTSLRVRFYFRNHYILTREFNFEVIEG